MNHVVDRRLQLFHEGWHSTEEVEEHVESRASAKKELDHGIMCTSSDFSRDAGVLETPSSVPKEDLEHQGLHSEH